MLKLLWSFDMADTNAQPPSGGCVLKHVVQAAFDFVQAQPPSGGCVLKPAHRGAGGGGLQPAAFGRLCVETAAGPAPRCAC